MDIKNYLHLYKKVPIAICEPGVEPEGHYLEGYDWHLEKAIAERVNYEPTWIKPILRPLSSMTDAEIIEFSLCLPPDADELSEDDDKDFTRIVSMIGPLSILL